MSQSEDDYIIRELIFATEECDHRFVGIDISEGRDQDTKDRLLLTNISFPSAEIKQSRTRAANNPKKKPAGYIALRIKHAVIRYDLTGATFKEYALAENHIAAEKINFSEEAEGRNTTAQKTQQKGSIRGGLKALLSSNKTNKVSPHPHGKLEASISGSHSRSEDQNNKEDIQNTVGRSYKVKGQKYSRYGGQKINFSGDPISCEIEVEANPKLGALKGYVFPTSVAVKSLVFDSHAKEAKIHARWHVRGRKGFEIEEATGLFEILSPTSRARRSLIELALGRLAESLQSDGKYVGTLSIDRDNEET